MRLFLAVSPNAEARRQIHSTRMALERAAGEAASALRPVAADAAHLTVHFLGDIDAAKLAPLVAALGSSLSTDPFDLALGAPEVSPRSGPPRVVWMPVTTGGDRLAAAHAELGARLANVAIPLEARPFTPHLTLARVRDRERQLGRVLRERVPTVDADSIRWRVDHVTLFQSDLSGPSPRYIARHRVALGATRSGL